MTFQTALRLGRVSNLPTVWTNVLAAALIAGASSGPLELAALALAASLFYVGGMYLNDAFDREIDARERPERPIPSGQVGAPTAFGVGFGLLVAGTLALTLLGVVRGHGLPALLLGLTLGGLIVLYDVHHKGSALAPGVMGLCRAAVYGATAATLTGALAPVVLLAGATLCAYVVGLTLLAAQENLDRVRSWWPLLLLLAPTAAYGASGPYGLGSALLLALHLSWTALALRHLRARRIGNAVVLLIAGISWVDALHVTTWAPAAATPAALVATTLAVLLTRALQSRIPGT